MQVDFMKYSGLNGPTFLRVQTCPWLAAHQTGVWAVKIYKYKHKIHKIYKYKNTNVHNAHLSNLESKSADLPLAGWPDQTGVWAVSRCQCFSSSSLQRKNIQIHKIHRYTQIYKYANTQICTPDKFVSNMPPLPLFRIEQTKDFLTKACVLFEMDTGLQMAFLCSFVQQILSHTYKNSQ